MGSSRVKRKKTKRERERELERKQGIKSTREVGESERKRERSGRQNNQD